MWFPYGYRDSSCHGSQNTANLLWNITKTRRKCGWPPLNSAKGHGREEESMQIQYVTCRKTPCDCIMCYLRWKLLIAMVTMTINVTIIMAHSIKCVTSYLYEYDIHSMINVLLKHLNAQHVPLAFKIDHALHYCKYFKL